MDGPVLGRGDGEGECGLDGRLVPAGEAATRVGGLELRHGSVAILAVLNNNIRLIRPKVQLNTVRCSLQ